MAFSTTYNPTEKIWSAHDSLPYEPTVSMGKILINELQRNDDRIIQINHETDYKMTCKEMRLRALKIAENLTKVHGIKCGDHVTLLLRQNDNLVPLFIGLFSIGAVVNPLDVSFAVNEISHFLKITNPKLIICQTSVLNSVQQSLVATNLESKVIIVPDGQDMDVENELIHAKIDDLLEGYEMENLNFEIPSITDAAKELLLILCSSGTTGLPKGVCVTHYMLLKGAENWIEYSEKNIYFNPSLPLWLTFHVFVAQSILFGGSRVFTSQHPVSAKLMLEMIDKHKIKLLFAIPSTTSQMIKLLDENADQYDLSSYKYHMTGGMVILDQVVKGMQRHIVANDGRVVSVYGLSEIGGTATTTLLEYRETSAGKLTRGLQAKIVDSNHSDRYLGPNEMGEIMLRQKYPFIGYYNDAEQTRETFLQNGWVLTGDIGYFDEDGFLFLKDRKKEIFKYNAYSISPTELVQFIRKSFADRIEAVCVVGVPDPTEGSQNFLPTAIIVRRKNDKLTENEVAECIADNFSDAKKLRGGVYFVDALPTTRTGKIKLKDVQEMATTLFSKSM